MRLDVRTGVLGCMRIPGELFRQAPSPPCSPCGEERGEPDRRRIRLPSPIAMGRVPAGWRLGVRAPGSTPQHSPGFRMNGGATRVLRGARIGPASRHALYSQSGRSGMKWSRNSPHTEPDGGWDALSASAARHQHAVAATVRQKTIIAFCGNSSNIEERILFAGGRSCSPFGDRVNRPIANRKRLGDALATRCSARAAGQLWRSMLEAAARNALFAQVAPAWHGSMTS
jgi:hypothetical protein